MAFVSSDESEKTGIHPESRAAQILPRDAASLSEQRLHLAQLYGQAGLRRLPCGRYGTGKDRAGPCIPGKAAQDKSACAGASGGAGIADRKLAEGGGKVCSVTGFSGPAWKDGTEAGRGVPGKQYISHDHNLRNGHTDQGAAGGTMGVRDPG